MRPSLQFVFLLFFLCFFQTASFAQGNVLYSQDLSALNVDQLTDAEIGRWYQDALKSGMKEEHVYNLLSQKGITLDQLGKLKQRVGMLENVNQTAVYPFAQKNQEKATETPVVMQEEAIEKDLDMYGSELFSSVSTVFEPNLRIPAPASYILGPDDELIINIFGLSEQTYQLLVSKEGSVYIPNVGPIQIAGISIEKATMMIRNKLSSTIYSSMKSGKTDMQISLGKIKSIRTSVIGEAVRTGSFTVSSLTTVFNLLYQCGGPNKMGSYRSIEVIRGNEVIRKVDLYQFLMKGNQSDNILLQEGDIVRIPFREQTVRVIGQAKRPAKYEVLRTDFLRDLLNYCGGFSVSGYSKSVNIHRVGDKGKMVTEVGEQQFSSFSLQAGDEIFISSIPSRFLNRVYITGAVERPGVYALTSNLDLKSLIEKAGGLMPEAYLGNNSVFRKKENLLPEVVSVNLDSVLHHDFSFSMKNEDSVFIHSVADFKETQFIIVDGAVLNPTQFKWSDSISLSDVINLVGGFRYTADSEHIEIYRRVMDADVAQFNHQESQRLVVSIKSNIKILPNDQIFVRSQSGIADQRFVMLMGEVKVPGKYILEKSQDRLSDLFSRAEGFRSTADSVSITIRRSHKSFVNKEMRELLFQRLLSVNMDSIQSNEKLKSDIFKDYELVSVNRLKAMKNYESSDNLVLEDGDVITVEKNSKLVKVSGEVNYPTVISYVKGKHAKYYIRQAGSYTSNASKRRVVVIYPDGKAKSVKRIFCFKTNPKITERTEIFISPKPERESKKLSYGELALMVTSLGILANIVIAIIKL